MAQFHETTTDPTYKALYFHGGGYIVSGRAMLPATHVEALNESGFIVVSSDYRLGPTISVLDGPASDSVAAYEWAQNELPQLLEKEHSIRVDGKNIVTLGHSCGGGLALLMVRISPANRERLTTKLLSYETKLLAPIHPRPSLTYSDLNTSVIPSIILAQALNPNLARRLHPRLNSSTKSLTRSLHQPQRVRHSVLTDSI